MNGIGNIRETKRSADSPYDSGVEIWSDLLINLGWSKYMGDDFHWKNATNRFVDIDFGEETYIDVYSWDGEEKAKSYLTMAEISAFNMLVCIFILLCGLSQARSHPDRRHPHPDLFQRSWK